MVLAPIAASAFSAWALNLPTGSTVVVFGMGVFLSAICYWLFKSGAL